MKTYSLDEGKQDIRWGFSIDNVFISPQKLSKVLEGVPGVEEIQVPRRRWFAGDIRVRFKCNGHNYLVVEPYADNSRYMFLPADPDDLSADISQVRTALDEYQPLLPIRVLGNLIKLIF